MITVIFSNGIPLDVNYLIVKIVGMSKRKINEKSLENLKLGGLARRVGEEPLSRSPVSVKLPPELDDYVRSQPNRNQWLIAAIAEKAAKEQQMAEQAS